MGFTSNNSVAINCVSQYETSYANRDSDEREDHSLAYHESEDATWSRPQRHAHTDVARTLRDRIRRHAIDTDRCQQRRQSGKRRQQKCGESLRRDQFGNRLLIEV